MNLRLLSTSYEYLKKVDVDSDDLIESDEAHVSSAKLMSILWG